MGFAPEDLEATVRVLNQINEMQKRGDSRALPLDRNNPGRSVYDALFRVVQQPAAECMIVTHDLSMYCVPRRKPGQQDFGHRRLHIFGGYMKPYLKDVSTISYANDTAKKELGFGLKYIAGPIATYAWQRDEHPVGFPESKLYVFEPTGEIPESDELVWIPADTLPSKEEIIVGRAGEIHLALLRVFQAWRTAHLDHRAFNSIDLNLLGEHYGLSPWKLR